MRESSLAPSSASGVNAPRCICEPSIQRKGDRARGTLEDTAEHTAEHAAEHAAEHGEDDGQQGVAHAE